MDGGRPRKASAYYFNRDALTAEDFALMNDGQTTPEQASAILARFPPSLDAAFATSFDEYAGKTSSIMARLMDTWLVSAARKQGVMLDAETTVTVSRARLSTTGSNTAWRECRVYAIPANRRSNLKADGYFVSIQTEHGTHHLFLCTGDGTARSLPAHGPLEAWIKEHRLSVFESTGVQAADRADMTASRVVVDAMASGRHADLAQWLVPALRAEVERVRESARGQTMRESVVDTLLDFIPFRAMIVAIQKGDAQKAIVSGWLDVLSLILLLGRGAHAGRRRQARAALYAACRDAYSADAHGRDPGRMERGPIFRVAGGGPARRFAQGGGCAGTRGWVRLRPLDVERVAAALRSRYPGLADHLERIARKARGPVVPDGWWRVPTPSRPISGAGAGHRHVGDRRGAQSLWRHAGSVALRKPGPGVYRGYRRPEASASAPC